MITQGDVCWAELPAPVGSGPGFRRPVVVVQADSFNRSSIRTVVCVALTSNRTWASSPGNVELSERETSLPRPSVANVTQLVTLDRALLEVVGRVPPPKLELILRGVDLVLGRE